jgi:hypothetical protein
MRPYATSVCGLKVPARLWKHLPSMLSRGMRLSLPCMPAAIASLSVLRSCIRPHTSAYVSIRQPCMPAAIASLSVLRSCIRPHTSAYVSIRQHTSAYVSIRQHTSAYVSVPAPAKSQAPHTSAYVRIRPHTSAYVRIRQHMAAYVSIRQRTCPGRIASTAIDSVPCSHLLVYEYITVLY